jgi:hypothetical protein
MKNFHITDDLRMVITGPGSGLLRLASTPYFEETGIKLNPADHDEWSHGCLSLSWKLHRMPDFVYNEEYKGWIIDDGGPDSERGGEEGISWRRILTRPVGRYSGG